MDTNTKSRGAALLMIAALVILSGCAQKTPGEPLKITGAAEDDGVVSDNDPLESVNRGLFKVHEIIDGVFLSPMAHIYRGVMPQFAQNGVRNVLTNAASPVVLANSILQGDTDNISRTVGRFMINTTVGVGGIFDMASKMGIPKYHQKDFGQTMGVYGVGPGPYLVIPGIETSDARDALGIVADIFADPFTYILTTDENYGYIGVQGLVKRTDLLPLTDRVYRDSLDPYVTFRSIYLQHRAKVIRDYRGRDAGLEHEK